MHTHAHTHSCHAHTNLAGAQFVLEAQAMAANIVVDITLLITPSTAITSSEIVIRILVFPRSPGNSPRGCLILKSRTIVYS